MHILVTAGNTVVPIDRVRCMTNIFTGRTGAAIALVCHECGHAVRLLTSHPETVAQLHPGTPLSAERWSVQPYRTFQELQGLMERAVRGDRLDVVIHCAAVSDYEAAGVFASDPATRFEPETRRWLSPAGTAPTLVDRAAGKIKSDEPELWLRLVRTPKLIDRIRPDWGFRGILVKFKLEVGLGDEELLAIAERSRRHSDADLMVANTLEEANAWAFLGPEGGHYERVSRADLPARLLAAVERLRQERTHG
jgi:phosphopantothenoylcysteine synthetase/decarboxylase